MLQYEHTSDFLDTTQIGALLRRLSRVTIILTGVYSLLVFLVAEAHVNAIFSLALLIIGLGVLYSVGRLHPHVVGVGMVCAVWIVLTVSIFTGPLRGIEDPSFAGYVVTVFLAGFLLGEAAGYSVAILSSLSGLATILLGVQPDMHQLPFSQAMLAWFTHTGYFAVAAVLLSFAGRIIREARRRAGEDASALQERNAALERQIAERIQAEQALSEKEARLRLALRVAQMTPWDWDLQSGAISYPHAASLDWLPDLSTYRKLLQAVPQKDHAALQTALDRALEQDQLYFVEHRLIGKDGSIHWFAQTGQVQRDADGKAIHISGVTQDITERKQIELALKSTERLFSQAFHANPSAMIITDARNGRIVDLNASCIELFGYSREECIGRTGAELGIWKDVTDEARAAYVRTLQETGMMREVPLMAYVKSGEPIEVRAFVEAFEQDGIPYYLTIYQDMREQRRLQQKTLELALQQQRVELLSEFMSKITHDLKTPLSVIESGLYLVERIQDEARRREKIAQVKMQVERIDRYIQDILTVLRLESVPQIQKSEQNIELLIRMSVERMQQAAEDKQIALKLTVTPPLPPLRGDAGELERVFGNLIENAIRYTPSGGAVEVRARQADDAIIVEVADTGIGMKPEEIEKIFTPFYRTPGARSFWGGGTGLGLAIVQRIVHLHGGRVTVESQPDAGSTFRVCLPLSDAAT